MTSTLQSKIKNMTRPQSFGTSATIETLALDRIRTNGGTQARAKLNDEAIEDYAQMMHAGATFEAITVYYDGAAYWLADGFHRVEAAKKAGRAEIAADIRPGDLRAAKLHAFGANKNHGVRRSREDVRRSIEAMLTDEQWTAWPDREIARHVGCHHETVGVARARLVASGGIRQIESRTVERNGTVYQQAVKAPATPPPLPDHLAAAGYRLVRSDEHITIIADPHGGRCDAKDMTGALGLAEDRYQARMSSPQQQPTAPDRLPDAPDGWRWTSNAAGEHLLHCAVDGWETRAYRYAQRALAEANRHILSQPKPAAADVGAASSTATIPADITDAARALGLIARLDGGDLWLYWPIEADGLGDTILPWLWPQQADEVRAWLRDDAPGLAPEPQPTSTPAPADWRRDPALVQAVARFNDAVRGNDRANVLRAVRAVVAALEAMED